MKWRPEEFLQEMAIDPDRRVLFVEGARDLVMWRRIVPLEKRRLSAVYPASALEIGSQDGGEKGRLMVAARHFLGAHKSIRDRTKMFVDADCDRVLFRAVPENVVLTDGRDLESYALSEPCLAALFDTIFQRNTPSQLAEAQERLRAVGRPLGLLRVASERQGLHLPFRRTLEGNLSRYLDRAGTLDVERLKGALLQNAQRSLGEREALSEYVEYERTQHEQLSDDQLIHGKDAVQILAHLFKVGIPEMERHLLSVLSLNCDKVRVCGNVAKLETWLTGC